MKMPPIDGCLIFFRIASGRKESFSKYNTFRAVIATIWKGFAKRKYNDPKGRPGFFRESVSGREGQSFGRKRLLFLFDQNIRIA